MDVPAGRTNDPAAKVAVSVKRSLDPSPSVTAPAVAKSEVTGNVAPGARPKPAAPTTVDGAATSGPMNTLAVSWSSLNTPFQTRISSYVAFASRL